jgi:hypothetical protein
MLHSEKAMKKIRRVFLITIGPILGLSLLSILAFAQTKTTVVRPVEIHEALVNPGIGITTFQRFNRQAIYPDLHWSEVGPESKIEDAPADSGFPETSVAYLRWFWHQIEPEQGRYRWEIIDSALEEAARHHQQLMVRIMPYDQKDPLPEWYRKSGARRANKDTDEDGKIWSPDSDDPFYIKTWSALVIEFGKRYDGHPFLDTVDISTVGYWGEGWGPHLPSRETQTTLIDVYFEAFKRTHLLMNFDVIEMLAYGTQRGAGWRLDCWGDMGRPGHTFIHMLDRYPQGVVAAGAQEVWRRSPVSLETCGTPGSWHQNPDYDLRYVMEQALRWHASTINVKSTAIPNDWKPQFQEFQKKVGYRFVLRRLEYPETVTAGHMMAFKTWWFNAGVSPVYYDYTLAFQIRSEETSVVLPTSADVKQWLPGDAIFDSTLYVPHTLKPGKYRFRTALLHPTTREPAIRLAIQGRQADGWYDLGDLQIQ